MALRQSHEFALKRQGFEPCRSKLFLRARERHSFIGASERSCRGSWEVLSEHSQPGLRPKRLVDASKSGTVQLKKRNASWGRLEASAGLPDHLDLDEVLEAHLELMEAAATPSWTRSRLTADPRKVAGLEDVEAAAPDLGARLDASC